MSVRLSVTITMSKPVDGSIIVVFCGCRQSGKDDGEDDIKNKVKDLLKKLDKAADEDRSNSIDTDDVNEKLPLQEDDVDIEPQPINFNYGTDDDDGPQPTDDKDEKPEPYNMNEVHRSDHEHSYNIMSHVRLVIIIV